MNERIDFSTNQHTANSVLYMPVLPDYIYTYACHEDEQELCLLELRRLLMNDPTSRYVRSPICIAPERSPFIHQRLDIWITTDTLEELEQHVRELQLAERNTVAGIEIERALAAKSIAERRVQLAVNVAALTFKLVCLEGDRSLSYEEKRSLERRIGMNVRAKAQMKQPDVWLGMIYVDGQWLFGQLWQGESVWLQHNDKPHHYSTALSTRVARAVVNIAMPQIEKRTLLDPCCGIGTVLIEALSMGINVTGSDLNPLAVQGARANLLFYGMPDIVRIADLRQLDGMYDAVILDLPYNLCSVLEAAARLDMLRATTRLARLQVIISTEPLEHSLAAAGLVLSEVCRLRKGRFTRYVWLCMVE
ncbi:TRM11 family SAM-dependent methyltransferase [Paenibacillus campi]|uniref:TRM11 family SAM-dependent methyltransferase n=1 Tax=Paenibacillus campi TaxID=3106031 RepID=UPI002AFF46CE|nr:RsmD family RNA methyltransferase [Paenibacillus sp. SGZ-1014]